MVSKIKSSKKEYINTEKYALILLLFGYVLGILIGCFFVYSNAENAELINNLIKDSYVKKLIYFISALILKYSGILSGAICTLPIFSGIQNSAYYCSYILNSDKKIIYKIVLKMLSDTALTILLILYLIIIINQIANKKYNLKKDFKYFSVYIGGSSIIIILKYVLENFIF